MARKIGRDDLHVRPQRAYQRKEVFELGAKGVEEDDRRASTGAQETDVAAEHIDELCLQSVAQRSRSNSG